MVELEPHVHVEILKRLDSHYEAEAAAAKRQLVEFERLHRHELESGALSAEAQQQHLALQNIASVVLELHKRVRRAFRILAQRERYANLPHFARVVGEELRPLMMVW